MLMCGVLCVQAMVLMCGVLCVQAMVLMCGAKVGFYQGDVKLLIEDMQALQPTLFASVPRLLNRVYDKVLLLVHACYSVLM